MAASNSLPRSEDADRSATRRILDAAAREVARVGAAELSMSDIARAAGVSKALIHYHFADKETLLARLIDQLARGLVERERTALAAYEHQHNPLAVDALWAWLDDELRRGEIRVLLELDSYRGATVQSAARAAAEGRRAAAADTVRQLFTILELRPRIDASLLAWVFVAFIDGLAIGAAPGRTEGPGESSSTTPRVAFDVFWLAMLSLAE